MEYLDSPRHANCVETHTWHVLAAILDSFGWPARDDEYFETARRDAARVLATGR
ncbi:MAG TPA: hypothetical protein VH307_22340 [Streptosporangiaceae bacterium]|jgi:hypothetical protein|nr:hypothetical protein [Streptosporangiaceae bacterium]